jgi:cytochrome c biogenesis protein CcmG, thiol:disulfide interchange protein DsbE
MNLCRALTVWLIVSWTVGIAAATTVMAAPPIGQPSELSIGQPAPDFDLTLFNGKKISLASLRGKSVIINFWHSMCRHCQQEAPILETAYETYRKRGLVIIGLNISQNDETLARDFVKKYKLKFPVGHDTGEIGLLYGFKALPLMIFVDRAGNLVERNTRELTREELRQRIENLLK